MRPVGRVWGLPASAAALHSKTRLATHFTILIAVERARFRRPIAINMGMYGPRIMNPLSTAHSELFQARRQFT
jgi:hypothetical protein